MSDRDDDNDDEYNDDESRECESCGSTDNVSEDPNGELLCSDCAEEAWL